MRSSPLTAPPAPASQVNELLAARLHARLNRDFVAADRMREQLRNEHGVEVEDAGREWRATRDAGGAPTRDGGAQGGAQTGPGEPMAAGEDA